LLRKERATMKTRPGIKTLERGRAPCDDLARLQGA
jgi:hypothetical protein